MKLKIDSFHGLYVEKKLPVAAGVLLFILFFLIGSTLCGE